MRNIGVYDSEGLDLQAVCKFLENHGLTGDWQVILAGWPDSAGLPEAPVSVTRLTDAIAANTGVQHQLELKEAFATQSVAVTISLRSPEAISYLATCLRRLTEGNDISVLVVSSNTELARSMVVATSTDAERQSIEGALQDSKLRFCDRIDAADLDVLLRLGQ